ncbi:MAG TPA: diguanylate cyclase [Spirochaetota bacterium]|nr:diguanylate cyclase [Spirochaetota bacterium]HPF08070.1 diguanylate cyclase [Spirochaetota bacterium]HRX48350.1 diguanylate cyclase [Spirochaetota bacterium]
MSLKDRVYKSIGFKIIAFYILLSLINLSFVISIIFENQVDTIGKNTMLESEKQISELIGAMKKFTVEMKKGNLFETASENEALQQLVKIIDLHFREYLIISEKDAILHKSTQNEELPESFKEDTLRAMTASAFSGKDYYLRIDEGKKNVNFYIPLNDFYPGNSILLIKKDISALNRSLADLYKQVSYVILVVVFFHLVFAGFLYLSFILPLKSLVKAAENFSAGDMTARVKLPGKNFELKAIASAFNNMAESAHNSILSLSTEIESAKNNNRKKEKSTTRDELTGLLNSNYLNERIDEEIDRGKLLNSEFSLMLIDIDDFSRINAIYGKQTGDIILLETAKKITNCCSKSYIAARITDDEFAILSTGPGVSGITDAAENIRKIVEENSIVTPDGNFSVTVSIGIATFNPAEQELQLNPENIFKSALSALSKAKAGGKNRVEFR